MGLEKVPEGSASYTILPGWPRVQMDHLLCSRKRVCRKHGPEKHGLAWPGQDWPLKKYFVFVLYFNEIPNNRLNVSGILKYSQVFFIFE